MIRKQSAEEQIATMQRLIKFGTNESVNTSKPIVEFKRKAANGKTYGIIRESTKYYIMEAPQKDTEILAEDFDYIGGFNNRKENEYSSYSKASNALDLKIMSINEAVEKKDRVVIEAPVVKAEWEDNLTESMRKEIDRFKTITNNVANILREDKQKSWGEIPSEHTLPEAPDKNPSDEKVNAPYVHSGVANGEKDFKDEEHNHETAGTPFDKDATSAVEKNMTSDKKPVVKTDAEYLTKENTYEPDNNVASEHPNGGKVVKVNENKGKRIRLKLTEEQVLAWNDNKNYIDTSNGTHVGSSDPFVDELGKESNQTEADTDPIIKEGNGDSVVYDHPNAQSEPTPGTTDVETEDGDPFVKPINEVEGDEAAGFDDVPFPEVEDDLDAVEAQDNAWDNEGADEDEYEITMDDEAYNDANEITPEQANADIEELRRQLAGGEFNDDFYGDDDLYETRSRKARLSEDKLNVWGKHPAWRKQPMTTPPNKEVAINGAREWDDESAQGEEPYAKQIGDGSPFNQIVNEIAESLIKKIYGNKKKV